MARYMFAEDAHYGIPWQDILRKFVREWQPKQIYMTGDLCYARQDAQHTAQLFAKQSAPVLPEEPKFDFDKYNGFKK